MRARIGIVLCVLVLSGGSVWAQPGPEAQAPTWLSWAQWVDVVHSWLTHPWAEPEEGTKLQAETARVKVEPALDPAAQSETCPPGETRANCSLDPNG